MAGFNNDVPSLDRPNHDTAMIRRDLGAVGRPGVESGGRPVCDVQFNRAQGQVAEIERAAMGHGESAVACLAF